MVQTFTDVGGAASTSNGQVDTEVLEVLVLDHAHGLAAAELGAALDIAPVTARHRVDAACDLHDQLPGTHLALTEGRIDRGRAALIAERTSVLEPELRLQVEAIVLPLVAGRTAGRLRPLIDRAVLIADPDAANKRIEKAHRNREVTHQPIKDQMSVIRAVLPADGAVSVFTLIDLLADATKSSSDDRDVAQRRADALTDLATEMLTHGRLDLRGLLHPAEVTDDDSDDSDDSDDCRRLREGLARRRAGDDLGARTRLFPHAHASNRQACRPHRLAGSEPPGPPPSSHRHDVVVHPHGTGPVTRSPRGLRRHHRRTCDRHCAAAASLSLAVLDTATGRRCTQVGATSTGPGRRTATSLAFSRHAPFPSCRQPAWRCDLDHRDPFDHRDPGVRWRNGSGEPRPVLPAPSPDEASHRLDATTTPRRNDDVDGAVPNGHRYTDHPRELALPGEQPAQSARYPAVGLADREHREQCGRAVTREEPTPAAVRIHLAMRRAFREQVRDRIRTAQQTGRLGGTDVAVSRKPTNTDPVPAQDERSVADYEWIDAVITRSLSSDSDRSKWKQPRPLVQPRSPATGEIDDVPPF